MFISTHQWLNFYFQYSIATLAKVEEAYKYEKATKETMEEVFLSNSSYHLKDTLDAAQDDTDENRLLPAMNKLWPFLVICVRSKDPIVSNLNTFSCTQSVQYLLVSNSPKSLSS